MLAQSESTNAAESSPKGFDRPEAALLQRARRRMRTSASSVIPSSGKNGRLWCKEHERYEDRCFVCHPELRDEDAAVLRQARALRRTNASSVIPELKDKPSSSDEGRDAGVRDRRQDQSTW